MISDILIIALIVIFIFIGIKRGFAKCLLNLAGLIVNIMLTQWLSGFLSGWIYESFIRQSVIDNLQNQIMENGYTHTVANAFDSVPEWIRTMVESVFSFSGISLQDLQSGVFVSNTQSQSLAQSIERPLGEIIITVISMLMSVLLFIVFMVLIKILIRFVLKFFNIPVIKQIDRTIGGILGFIEGIIFVCVAINIIYVIMTYASPTSVDNQMYFGEIFRMLCMYI